MHSDQPQQIQLIHDEVELVEDTGQDSDKIQTDQLDTLNDSLDEVLKRDSIIKSLEDQQEVVMTQSEQLVSNKINKNNSVLRDNNVETPENNLIIKTKNITPMPNYDEMDTPKVRKELDKIGVKPLKRRRGVQLLKYIYESTHPRLDLQEVERLKNDEEENRIIKKRKIMAEPILVDKEETVLNKKQENIDIIGDALLQK